MGSRALLVGYSALFVSYRALLVVIGLFWREKRICALGDMSQKPTCSSDS